MRLYENTSGAVIRKKRTMSAPGSAYPDFLVHYGISGQKWGVRRFQNEDGTLTEEGKARYNEGRPESETWRKSDAKYLSDEELRRRTNRLQQEQNYKNLTTTESERNNQQIKNDFKKKLITALAITPIIAIAGVASKKHLAKAVSLIGDFGKRALNKIKVSNAISKYQNKLKEPYTRGPGPNISAYQKFMGNDYSMPRPFRGMHGAGARMFNYRPRTNNALPKTRRWPVL